VTTTFTVSTTPAISPSQTIYCSEGKWCFCLIAYSVVWCILMYTGFMFLFSILYGEAMYSVCVIWLVLCIVKGLGGGGGGGGGGYANHPCL
jgi:hypothetical protein